MDHLLSMVMPVSHIRATTSPDKAFSRIDAADRPLTYLATCEPNRGNKDEHASRVEGPAIVRAQANVEALIWDAVTTSASQSTPRQNRR